MYRVSASVLQYKDRRQPKERDWQMEKNQAGEGYVQYMPSQGTLFKMGDKEQAGWNMGRDNEVREEEDELAEMYSTVASPENVYGFVYEVLVIAVDVIDQSTGEYVPTFTIRTLDGEFVTHIDCRVSEESRIAMVLQAEAISKAIDQSL